MELLRGRGFAYGAGASEPGGEGFIGEALGLVGLEERAHGAGDVREGDHFVFQAGEAVTGDASADEHGVFARSAADEAEIRVVGAAAAVRAAGHADEDRIVLQAEFAQHDVDLIEHAGHDAFGLAQAQPAGRQGDTGVRDAAGGGHAVGMRDVVACEDGVDYGFLVRGDISNDEIGVRRDDEREAKVTRDLVECAQVPRAVVAVDDASHVDIHRAVQPAVALLEPAQLVLDGREVERFGRLDGDARQAADDLVAERVQAHRFERVLEARVLAVGAISVVALGGHDCFGCVHHVAPPDVKQRLRQVRPGGELAVAHAESAAHRDRVAFDDAVDDMRDEAEVLREHIDIVARLDRDADLEFPRQVPRAVNRIRRGRAVRGGRPRPHRGIHLRLRPGRIQLLAVQPDVRVRRALPQEPPAEFLAEALRIGMRLVLDRRRRSHRVSHDIAARPDRRQPAPRNAGDH